MTEAEAWRRLRREERAHREFVRAVRSLELTLEGMTLDLQIRLREQHAELVEEAVAKYAHDAYFMKVLKRFHGHTAGDWRCAAYPDGRIARLADDSQLGWETLAEVVRRIRRIYYGH